MKEDSRVVVIGAGIGGLAAAAALARAGLPVTVLEAHLYPGGCAGTFYYQGYRFDAGATLAAGFYPGGPMDRLAQAAGIASWPVRPAEPAMLVHLPGGDPIPLWGDERRFAARREAFGPAGEPFWRWQEATASALWDLALRLPPWPPGSPRQAARLAGLGLDWLAQDPGGRINPSLWADLFRPVAAHLRSAPERLRLFVDAQLLISAQAESQAANAWYGAAALDLPRRAVVHFAGGMGALAWQLVESVRRHGGQVHFRQPARRIVMQGGRPVAVETRRGDSFPAGTVIANLTPADLAQLLRETQAGLPSGTLRNPQDGWGAFVVYLGLDGTALPDGFPLHHQVVAGRPLGEGNSVFLSISPAWDGQRAPLGKRALTLSTHTALAPWWALYESDQPGYAARKAAYTEKVMAVTGRALPALREAAELLLPGTPVTFQRFTRRARGWVGGFPQTGLLRARAPQVSPGLWLVGDSLFPGQSTTAVALGGLRVAGEILDRFGLKEAFYEDRYRREWDGRRDRCLRPADARHRP